MGTHYTKSNTASKPESSINYLMVSHAQFHRYQDPDFFLRNEVEVLDTQLEDTLREGMTYVEIEFHFVLYLEY